MARKDLLKGLIAGDAPRQGADPAPPSPAPRRTKGAIGAVSQSIADLKARALVEVESDMIDDAGLADRLDADDGLDALMESIREYGQQVPVLLRYSPNHEGRYEVVYGRRRVAALKKLGLPVRAMLRELNDRDLIVAQGQENSARKDLSFIEKANFARQMVEMGFERKVICDALHIDKTVISRMLSVVEAVPPEVIRAIGAAPSAGRDRWLALADRMKGKSSKDVAALARGENSDTRFASVFGGLAPPKAAKAAPQILEGSDGAGLGQVAQARARTTLILDRKSGFDDWLLQNMERIHREFLTERGE
ncbi:plasmid partitioning protein RepB [Amaricoccus macauensis]|uniref:plasmid partitioning protein RepB n=1 Tax=Amaricoccus macauensis TaxID=57001 RepID=UPI003C7AA096